jgi:hypothetical protein
MSVTIALITLGYAVTLTNEAALAQKMRPCDDCNETGKTPKRSEYSKKGFRLFLCEECTQIRDHKRTS